VAAVGALHDSGEPRTLRSRGAKVRDPGGECGGPIEFTGESLVPAAARCPLVGAIRSVQVAAAAPVIRSVAVNRTAGDSKWRSWG